MGKGHLSKRASWTVIETKQTNIFLNKHIKIEANKHYYCNLIDGNNDALIKVGT